MHPADGENAGQRAEIDELLDPDVHPQTPPLVGMSVVVADRSAVPIVGRWPGASPPSLGSVSRSAIKTLLDSETARAGSRIDATPQ